MIRMETCKNSTMKKIGVLFISFVMCTCGFAQEAERLRRSPLVDISKPIMLMISISRLITIVLASCIRSIAIMRLT